MRVVCKRVGGGGDVKRARARIGRWQRLMAQDKCASGPRVFPGAEREGASWHAGGARASCFGPGAPLVSEKSGASSTVGPQAAQLPSPSIHSDTLPLLVQHRPPMRRPLLHCILELLLLLLMPVSTTPLEPASGTAALLPHARADLSPPLATTSMSYTTYLRYSTIACFWPPFQLPPPAPPRPRSRSIELAGHGLRSLCPFSSI